MAGHVDRAEVVRVEQASHFFGLTLLDGGHAVVNPDGSYDHQARELEFG